MLQRFLSLLKESFATFSTQRCASRGAAIAFYTATSIAPVLLIVIAVAGLAFGQDAASGAIFAQFRGLLGAEGADLLQKAVLTASNKSASIAASIISVITLIATASGVFVELEDALNAIWDAERKGGGIWNLARARILSLGLVVALGFLLFVSLVIDAGLKGLGGFIDAYLPFGAVLLLGISFIISLMLLTILFAAMFKFVPSKKLSWREVMPGAAVTALLFQIGKFLIGLYLGSSSAASSLGAAGALLGLLFWIYYSGQIFLFGAAFTQNYSQPKKSPSDQKNETRNKRNESGALRDKAPPRGRRDDHSLIARSLGSQNARHSSCKTLFGPSTHPSPVAHEARPGNFSCIRAPDMRAKRYGSVSYAGRRLCLL